MINLEIKGFIPSTMLDWEGMLASTVFLPRCNFRCPFCHNSELVLAPENIETVPLFTIKRHLRDRKGWIEGVCITGGEPCLHAGLPELCRELRSEGVGVKLDTNGTFPGVVERLITDGLVDYISMDLKAPLEPGPYRAASGLDDPRLLEAVLESIELLRSSGVSHEFRTTVVPMMHGPAEVGRIAKHIAGDGLYVLQHFTPRDTIDVRFSDRRPFTEEDMDRMLAEARKYVPRTTVRGAPAPHEA